MKRSATREETFKRLYSIEVQREYKEEQVQLYIDQNEIDDANDYNTRSSHLAGKLPIGPICNPSIDSILAVIHPEENDYYYFVSDKNGKTYFSKTYKEHLQTKNDLMKAGLWYTYD